MPEKKRAGSSSKSEKDAEQSRESKVENFVNNMAEQLVSVMQNCGKWEKTWVSPVSLLPYNADTGKKYSGVNSLILMITEWAYAYNDHRWMTFAQLKKIVQSGKLDEKEVHIKKGEKGTHILYPKKYWRVKEEDGTLTKVTEKEALELIAGNGGVMPENLEYKVYFQDYAVFNACQIANFPAMETPADAFEFTEESRNQLIDDFVEYTRIPVSFGEFDPCYAQLEDVVYMPPIARFDNIEEFYATELHELFHATGHEKRENRSGEYSYEEMRAEIFSVLAGRYFNLPLSMENAAAYIKTWNQRFSKDDASAVFKAARDAMNVFQYMLDFSEGIKPKAEWLKDIPDHMLVKYGAKIEQNSAQGLCQ